MRKRQQAYNSLKQFMKFLKYDSLMTRVISASVCVKRSKRHVPSKSVCGELFPVCVSSSSTFKTSTSLQTQSSLISAIMHLLTAFLLMILIGKVNTRIQTSINIIHILYLTNSTTISQRTNINFSPQDTAHLNICRHSPAPMRIGIYLRTEGCGAKEMLRMKAAVRASHSGKVLLIWRTAI